ncbi:MAG TPA: hypothetical protein VF752_15310 [Thermoleophilaceae bacterium]
MSTETGITTDWERRARDAEAALEESLRERNRLWEELQALKADAREVEAAKREVYRVETSASWKVTRPLRFAKTIWHKVKRRLDLDS